MENKDKKQFANVMNKAAILYDKDISNTFINAYWELLKDYELIDVSAAVGAHCRISPFWPKVSEIISKIDGMTLSPKQLAQEKAICFINAVSGKDWKNPKGWKDDTATKILLSRKRFKIKDLFRGATISDLRWIERDFIEAYIGVNVTTKIRKKLEWNMNQTRHRQITS